MTYVPTTTRVKVTTKNLKMGEFKELARRFHLREMTKTQVILIGEAETVYAFFREDAVKKIVRKWSMA